MVSAGRELFLCSTGVMELVLVLAFGLSSPQGFFMREREGLTYLINSVTMMLPAQKIHVHVCI